MPTSQVKSKPITSKDFNFNGYKSEYFAYRNAQYRCEHPNNQAYSNYGGRGIKFNYTSLAELINDIGPRPSSNHSIDRIDNNWHYEPGNCRWATSSEQCSNRRSNFWITLGDVTKTLTQWGRTTNISQHTIRSRLGLGWTVQDAITTPVDTRFSRNHSIIQ